jgi:hypothetical protein
VPSPVTAQAEPSPVPDPLRDPALRERPPTNPESALVWMNERYAVVREGGKTRVLTQRHDPGFNRRILERSGFTDFKNFYSNRRVLVPDGKDKDGNDKMRWEGLAPWWLQQPTRRQFNGVTFAPNQETPGLFNMWQGFGVEPAKGVWPLMHAHIADTICAGQAGVVRWLLAWMADAVQHPERPAEVAIVLRGPRGSGKGMFARSFGRVFGSHFVHVSSAKHLLGNFNAHLQDAVVVFADEAFLAGDRPGEGVLKMLITEPIIPIEPKHRDLLFARNLIHLLIASNHQWVVPAGHDERRFAVLDVATEHAQDHRYFAALAEELEHGGLAAMLHDLLARDYADVNLRQPPMTAGLFDQKLHSLEPAARWWYDKLMTGRLVSSLYPADEGWSTEIPREELQRDYKAAIADIGTRPDHSTETELGIKLKRFLPPGFPREIKRTIPGSTTPARLYVLPELDDCRRHFAQQYMKANIPWPE